MSSYAEFRAATEVLLGIQFAALYPKMRRTCLTRWTWNGVFWILLDLRFCHPGDPDHPDTPAEAREAVPEEEGRDWFPVFRTALLRNQGAFKISLV